MLDLIKKMNEYWDSHEPTEFNSKGEGFINEQSQQFYELTDEILTKCFTGSRWIYDAEKTLNAYDFSTRIVDSDSFGILSVKISKNNKYIMVG